MFKGLFSTTEYMKKEIKYKNLIEMKCLESLYTRKNIPAIAQSTECLTLLG